MHIRAVDLQAFMDRVGATDAEVADAVERDRTTINRIRRKVVDPDAETLLRISRWAQGVAKRKRLRKSEQLSWDYLLGDEPGKAHAAPAR